MAIEHAIEHRPDFAMLRARLSAGQKLFAEPSVMATMDPSIELKAGLKGGVLKSIGRAFGGESLIINTYTAPQGGELTLAPGPMGDLVHYRLEGGRKIMLQRGAFVAHEDGVEVSGSWQGARGFFSGEGLVLLQASGEGDLFFNSYGAILPVDVSGRYMVDTGYVVAFEDTLGYSITTLPGLSIGSRIKSFLFGGEGLVVDFHGQGRLWVQTRAIGPFVRWVQPFRPTKSGKGSKVGNLLDLISDD